LTEWSIRGGTGADSERVLALWRLAGNLLSPIDNERTLEGLLARDPSSLLVADGGAGVVGSLIVGWDGWRGSFYRLAVHPEWRRQGLATALVRAGERALSDLGATRLTAIVASDEPGASSLWESVGYEAQENRSRFVRMLGD
jgi:ribosomal protein S18 acetylase RimI-like enzyme